MQTQSIYKSPAGEKAIMELYEKVLADWPVPAEELYIDTSQGRTYVRASGDPGAPPLVLLHGSGSNLATWGADVVVYSRHYRFFAVDIPGEAGKSAQQRADWSGDEFTRWMDDLLEEEEFQKSENIEEFRTSIRKIEEHVERARKVVHNMLGYARKMEPRLEDVDVNDTINQTINILENYARTNNIDIQTDMADNLPIIAGDQAQLQQVFLNLMTNAIDAIGKNGLIEVGSRCTSAHIQVDVKDDGPGLTEDKQKKVFDPFYTTKEFGKGTGLGLWVSYSIIEKMGGHIRVSSEAESGATFTVEIPIVIPEKK